MLKRIAVIFTCYLISSLAFAETVDLLFVYTPDGKSDFDAANASEEAILSHLNQSFDDVGTNIAFRNVGNYVMENYQEAYYGDEVYEDFNDTSQMHYDLLTANDKAWVKDVKEKRKIYAADIVVLLVGNADVEPDAGGQGPGGYFGSDGGYILVPAQFAWDEPIFSHEIQHVFGVSHEEMDAGDFSDLFERAHEVENFVDGNTNAHPWSDDFVGPVEETDVLQFFACDIVDDQISRWESGDILNAIAFYNYSDMVLDVFWTDYSGVEVPVATLSPGEAHGVSTASQHPWVIRNAEFPFGCVGGVFNRGPNYENLYFYPRHD